MLWNPLAVSFVLSLSCISINGATYEEFELTMDMIQSSLTNRNSRNLGAYDDKYATPVAGYGGATYQVPHMAPAYQPPSQPYPSNPVPSYGVSSTPYSNSTYLTLIPGTPGLVESDARCGAGTRNFCNYPDLPFIETLNIPNLYSGRKLPSGKCPVGYSKQPTMDCLNVAPAIIETTCCVFDTQPVTLRDFCTNRAGIQFSATFELCDGRSFIVSDGNAWQIDENFKILGGPYSLSILTGGAVSTGVDSSFVDSSCNVGFFQGAALRWLNLPNRTPNTDSTLAALLGTIPTNLCGGATCNPTAVNFGVCPNNGFCLLSVNLTSTTGTIFQQLFLLAPGFNSFITASQTPPGIAVTNNADLSRSFRNFTSATFIKSSNRLAFVDRSNNVFFYDPTGKFISGPTSLFDLFGICGGLGSAPSSAPIIYIPYPIFSMQMPPNMTNYQDAYQPIPNYKSAPQPPTYNNQQPTYNVQAPMPQYAPQPAYTNPPQTQAPSYNANPAPTYGQQTQPAPAPAYQQPPQPATYQAPPAPQQYTPAPAAPVYTQPPAPQPQAPVYQAPPAPQQYAPAPAAPVYTQPPAPQPQPYPQPAPSPVYQQPQYNQPAPAPSYSQSQPSPTPRPTYSQPQPAPAPVYTAPAPAATPAPVEYRPAVPVYSQTNPAPSYSVPFNTPYLIPAVPPAPVTLRPSTARPKDTVFKGQNPGEDFFDLTQFVRNGKKENSNTLLLL